MNMQTQEMQGRVCGHAHVGRLAEGGFFKRRSWQCPNGCSLGKSEVTDTPSIAERNTRKEIAHE